MRYYFRLVYKLLPIVNAAASPNKSLFWSLHFPMYTWCVSLQIFCWWFFDCHCDLILITVTIFWLLYFWFDLSFLFILCNIIHHSITSLTLIWKIPFWFLFVWLFSFVIFIYLYFSGTWLFFSLGNNFYLISCNFWFISFDLLRFLFTDDLEMLTVANFDSLLFWRVYTISSIYCTALLLHAVWQSAENFFYP